MTVFMYMRVLGDKTATGVVSVGRLSSLFWWGIFCQTVLFLFLSCAFISSPAFHSYITDTYYCSEYGSVHLIIRRGIPGSIFNARYRIDALRSRDQSILCIFTRISFPSFLPSLFHSFPLLIKLSHVYDHRRLLPLLLLLL